MATGRKTGGRRKGTPNRVTAEFRAAFQKHGDERVRLGAIQAAFDRGWGKAVQGVNLGAEVQVTAIERKIIGPEVIEYEGGVP